MEGSGVVYVWQEYVEFGSKKGGSENAWTVGGAWNVN